MVKRRVMNFCWRLVLIVKRCDGSVAPIFALGLVALCCVMGASIDYLRSQNTRTALQNALDSTVLALAAGKVDATADEATRYFDSLFNQSGVLGPSPTFTFGADGSVSAQSNLVINTLLLRLVTVKTLPVAAHAKAAKVASTLSDKAVVNFSATSVKGWFAKDIYAFVRDANGVIINQVKVLSHDWDDATGTRTIVPPVNDVTADFKLSGGETFGLMMRVWPAYPASGSSRDTVPPIDYYSDEPSPRIKKTGDCHSGETHEWEDAPNDYDPSQDDYHDFIYVMTCKEMVQDVKAPGTARLVE